MNSSVSKSKRLLIKGIFAGFCLTLSRVGFAAAEMVAVRIWPSSTYTRITFESNFPLAYRSFSLKSPNRLVVDIDNLALNPVLSEINKKIVSSDPLIRSIRVAQNKPNTVRIVVELKQKINPSIFTLKPISEFKYRLVVDLYPVKDRYADDPLLAILEQFNQGKLEDNSKKYQPAKKKNNNLVVVLDPGHGGEDPGAIGYYKTKEKVIVLQIARRLRDLLKKERGITVYMTRNEDVFLPLNVRVEKARALHADLFISIHADAFTNRSVKGSSVFALSTTGASSAAASYLAKTQNEADEIGGVPTSGNIYLDKTILDLVQSTKQKNSKILGDQLLKQLKNINKTHKGILETAGFAVLKAPDIPSVLVETAFISNLEEERLLRTAQFQTKIAQGLLTGIKNYIKLRKR